MRRIKSSFVVLSVVTAIFGFCSKLVFDQVYLTSKIVVDEEFHLPLGKAYCHYDFGKWHPKVTTLPGLYLLSSLWFGHFEVCSTYWLRLTSLLASFINIPLFYFLLNSYNDDVSWKNIWAALNLSLLPPLYFFSHLYYTDVASLTTILFLFLFAQKGNHYAASVFGMLSVLFRQNNIIWVGMVFGCYILRQLNSVNLKRSSRDLQVSWKNVTQLLRVNVQLLPKLKNLLHFWLNTISYGAIFVVFALFVYVNGSIVVGDKTAHEVTIHVPQIFYFTLFTLFFAWPYFVTEVPGFLKFLKNHKITCVAALLTSLVIVHFNTLVHPYLLADNRHYIFYIWNRFYGKYSWFRYCIVPVYLFSIYVIISKVGARKDVTFLLFFIPCTMAALVTQRLFEFRYFFIPYVLFRLQIKNVSVHALVYEAVTYCVLNAVTLFLFFNKSIQWTDYDYPQRIIW